MNLPWDTTTRANKLRSVAAQFVDQVTISVLGNHGAALQFEQVVTLLSPMTSNQAALKAAIGSYTTGFNTQITKALQAANGLFGGRPLAPKVVVLVSDGEPSAGDTVAAVKNQASIMAAAGVRIYTVMIGDPTPNALDVMSNIPANGGTYANALSEAQLDAMMANIAAIEACD